MLSLGSNMKTLLIFLLLTSVCYAGDYVCFDGGGYKTSKHFSVDGADLDKRADCLKVSRDVFNTVHKYSKVSAGQVVSWTQIEIDAYLQAQADAQEIAQKTAIESGNISTTQLLEALEDLGVITKKQVTDKVKENEGISLSP